ncbi:Detected protein of unknown function [Hibiscus syriacus]|uniref:Uncharacterized protein n=1 Tax=Hibiscus syriacus TaxID=106335 RepID=A0A6A2Y7R4_HIBSY|nr:Detected protein of unknown function [Hibiscus syriacus]
MATSSLKEYLKRYETKNEEEEQKKKRKKKKKIKPESSGMLVVDQDPIWQKPVKVEEDDSPDETPVVDEDIEVKRMKKLEQIRQRTRNDTPSPEPGLRLSNSDIEVLSPPRRSRDDLSPSCRRAAKTDLPESQVKASRIDTDLSPLRKRRVRNETPSPEPLVNSADGTDLSPPRKQRVRNDTQSSEPLVNRADGTDLSPPRKWRARNDTHSPKPLINRADADLSPPRKWRVRNDTPSPKRRVKPLREVLIVICHRQGKGQDVNIHQSPEPDMPPPRQSRRQTSELVHDSDLSPPRKVRGNQPVLLL